MTATAPRLTLLEMHDKLTRILEDRVKLYELSHRKGHLCDDMLERKRAEVRQIYQTFARIVQYGDEFKDFLQAKLALAERDAEVVLEARGPEIAELMRHPAAEAVLEEFPGATIEAVRNLPAPETTA